MNLNIKTQNCASSSSESENSVSSKTSKSKNNKRTRNKNNRKLSAEKCQSTQKTVEQESSEYVIDSLTPPYQEEFLIHKLSETPNSIRKDGRRKTKKRVYQRKEKSFNPFQQALDTPRPDNVSEETWSKILADCINPAPNRSFYTTDVSPSGSDNSISDDGFRPERGDYTESEELYDFSLLHKLKSVEQYKDLTDSSHKKQKARGARSLVQISRSIAEGDAMESGNLDALRELIQHSDESKRDDSLTEGGDDKIDNDTEEEDDSKLTNQSKAIHATLIETKVTNTVSRICQAFSTVTLVATNFINFENWRSRLTVNSVVISTALLTSLIGTYFGKRKTIVSHPLVEEPKEVSYEELREDIDRQKLVKEDIGLVRSLSNRLLKRDFTRWEVTKTAWVKPKTDIRGPMHTACKLYNAPQRVSQVKVTSSTGTMLMSVFDDRVSQHLTQQAGKSPKDFRTAAISRSRNIAAYNTSMAMIAENDDITVASLEHWARHLKSDISNQITQLPSSYF